MLNSTILDVAIGLIFCYASVALITSSIYEGIASFFRLRSHNLLQGLRQLLNAHDSNGQTMLLQIYNHARLHPTGNGTAASLSALKNTPAHINNTDFAIALIDSIHTAGQSYADLGKSIDSLHDPQLRKLLRSMYDQADGNLQHLHHEIASWFDQAMEKVSSDYKRQSQLWCFAIAFVFACAFNIDSVHLFSTLWQHPALLAHLSIPANTPDSAQALEQLSTLPIGWLQHSPAIHIYPLSINQGVGVQFVGWLITATAALFGAPFWFDTLQKIVSIRGSNKPSASSASV